MRIGSLVGFVVASAFPCLGAQILIEPVGLQPAYPTSYQANPIAAARISSLFEIQSASATLGTQTVSLEVTPDFSHWHSLEPFNITNLSSGTHFVHFTATDVFGNVGETNVPIVIDRPAELNVWSPHNGALARPLIHLQADSSDDLRPTKLRVTTSYGPWPLQEVFYFDSGVYTNVDLSRMEGSVVTINVTATDQVPFGNDLATEDRKVLSLSSPRYIPEVTVTGTVLDANERAILHTTANGELVRRDRLTGAATVLKTDYDEALHHGERLTPTGALVLRTVTLFVSFRLVDIRPDEEIDLGHGFNGALLDLEGRWALLNMNLDPLRNRTVLRDFVAKTNHVFDFSAREGDVAANGMVLLKVQNNFQSELYRFRGGELTLLEQTATNEFLHFPRTDGTNVLWYSGEGVDMVSTLHLLTPQGKSVLFTDTPRDVRALLGHPPLALNGGWSAFPRIGAQGQSQIWLRSPEGELAQATFYPGSSYIKTLLPDGDLILTVEGIGIVHVPRGGAGKPLSYDFGGTYFTLGGEPFAQWGSTLFALELEGQPIVLTSPQYNESSGKLSYYVTATEPGVFTLQRSTDFVNWTAVTRQSVSNNLPTRFEVETAPGFFRLLKN